MAGAARGSRGDKAVLKGKKRKGEGDEDEDEEDDEDDEEDDDDNEDAKTEASTDEGSESDAFEDAGTGKVGRQGLKVERDEEREVRREATPPPQP
jgi:hypothetical protein